MLYCFQLARKNKSAAEFGHLRPGEKGGSLPANYLLAFLTGTLWYGQFFFYNLGHVRLGKDYAFSSWAIHMIMLVLISNTVAVLFKSGGDAAADPGHCRSRARGSLRRRPLPDIRKLPRWSSPIDGCYSVNIHEY